jgi:hypothetical protein
MANASLSEVENRAGDTVLYSSGNECLAIKPDASFGSLQDALNERLLQAHAVIQMLAVDAVNDAADEDSLSKDIIVNALWAADMLLEQARQFLAELNHKNTHGPGETGTDEALEGIRAERAHKGGAA